MAEVVSGNLVSIVLEQDEADALARLLELEVINSDYEPKLRELAEAVCNQID